MNRSYQRELMKSHKLSLIKKFKSLLASGSNVLTPYHRKRLLGKKRKERGGMTDSDLWYRIKPRCKTGIQDLLLISEIANEEILKEIFFTRDERTGNIPINELFELLFPRCFSKFFLDICKSLITFLGFSPLLILFRIDNDVLRKTFSLGLNPLGSTKWIDNFTFGSRCFPDNCKRVALG